jgi:hypothetical protein
MAGRGSSSLKRPRIRAAPISGHFEMTPVIRIDASGFLPAFAGCVSLRLRSSWARRGVGSLSGKQVHEKVFERCDDVHDVLLHASMPHSSSVSQQQHPQQSGVHSASSSVSAVTNLVFWVSMLFLLLI